MALFVRQNDTRSELQKRIADDLHLKLEHDKPLEYEKPVSDIELDSHQSEHLGAILTIMLMLGVIGAMFFLMSH